MRYRPINGDPEDSRLGRFIPDDWTHVERYPLAAVPAEQRLARVPVVIGVNWYDAFDRPEQVNGAGEFWVGLDSLGTIRGGHCVCLEPGESNEDPSWWEFYDQGSEGACVGFGWSRCMSLLNKQLYAARWLWDRAKEIDQWPETNPGDSDGTSVRAAGDILRARGHVDWDDVMGDDTVQERSAYEASHGDGIKRFRWARSVGEVHEALGNPQADRLEAVPFLNSWGRAYPRRTWMPDAVLERLMKEDGEIAVPADR
jgi:hypothetical protein